MLNHNCYGGPDDSFESTYKELKYRNISTEETEKGDNRDRSSFFKSCKADQRTDCLYIFTDDIIRLPNYCKKNKERVLG